MCPPAAPRFSSGAVAVVKVDIIEVITTKGREVATQSHYAFAPMDTTERRLNAVIRYVKKQMRDEQVHTITIVIKD